MISKILTKTEVLRGFIQIPKESRLELIRNIHPPCSIILNGEPARLDKYGRLWSSYLKNRFLIGAPIERAKAKDGYQVTLGKGEHKGFISEIEQEEVMSISKDLENKTNQPCKVLEGDCLRYLDDGSIGNVHLTFLDPPYRQGKDYRFFDDNLPAWKYWSWLKKILHKICNATSDGGAIYFMQREKNAEQVLKVIRETGWNFQNLIVWKKKTSAVPCSFRFSKQYQIIAYATKGDRPRVFNKLRIDLPTLPGHKFKRENGVYLTDVWDDIRELTSGYFAGNEAIRDSDRKRVHTQQSPVALLLRIILSSTLPGDVILDPLAGTGTTLVVAHQLKRNSIGIEMDPEYVEIINNRLKSLKPPDNIAKYHDYYRFTQNLGEIWPEKRVPTEQRRLL